MIDLPIIDKAGLNGGGERYWRSIADLRNSTELREREREEFLPGASEPPGGASRRQFLQIMGASMAMAGLAACRRPIEKTLPYARQPEEIIPGEPLFYATAMPFRGVLHPLVVESHEGRPTKIEGNPEHPMSLGATSVFDQASLLNLYDPDRSHKVLQDGNQASWRDCVSSLHSLRIGAATRRIVILSEPNSSPTLRLVRSHLQQRFPQLEWITYRPEGDDVEISTTGSPARPLYKFSNARVIISLDADFLGPTEPNVVFNTAEFARGRRVDSTDEEPSRLYVFESNYSLTGGMADHRSRRRSSEIPEVARALADSLGVGMLGSAGVGQDPLIRAAASDLRRAGRNGLVVAGDTQPRDIHELASAINRALGAVGNTVTYMDTQGEAEPPQSQRMAALVQSMRSGAVDILVTVAVNPVYDAPAELRFEEALRQVDNSIHLGPYLDETGRASRWHVPQSHFLEAWGDGSSYDGTLSIIQPLIAPLYDSKSEIELLNALATSQDVPGYDLVREQWRSLIGGNFDEGWRRVLHDGFLPNTGSTAALASAAGRSGLASQPGPADWPFPEARSRSSSVSAPASTTSGGSPISRETAPGVSALPVTGPAAEGQAQPDTSSGRSGAATSDTAATAPAPRSEGLARPAGDGDLEIVFRLDPTILDGSFANNAWMQELPDPTTKLVWDNVALMSPATAEKLGVSVKYKKGQYLVDKVEIGVDDRSVRLPAWIQPGLADDSIHLYLGYGREITTTREKRKARFFDLDHYTDVYADGPIANGVGVNVAPLRSGAFERVIVGARVEKVDETYTISTTQEHGWMEGRPLFRMGTLEEYRAQPNFAVREVPALPGSEEWEKYPELWQQNHPAGQPAFQDARYYSNQWGMVIDLNTCTGCNACIVACDSENNVQMVGKDEVGRGREMQWLRVDRYFVGGDAELAEPRMVVQPLPCMHCENAPCEAVCPVAATVHSPDGTNQMIYNRCIGTRYCSNNCPYKVRRFNFFHWSKTLPRSVQMAQNPDVTVRSRGVMEKCTYCVQRIRAGQRTANIEKRSIRDGEVMTACQQACPAGAIIFGDLNDPSSQVSTLRKSPRRYEMLAELNTKPRTSYLARVTNPNPEIVGG